MLECFIGVDGGGSGSSGVVLNRNGGEIGAVEGFGVLNPYLVGLEAAVEVVLAVVEDLWRNVEEKDALLRVCCVAGSGLDTEEMRTRLRDSVQARLAERFGDVQLLVVEDTMGAIGFLGGKGAVVIAGTGSVARFVDKDIDIRCGGWGHVISDLGSAYYIATRALSDMVLAMEGIPREPFDDPGELWTACRKHFEDVQSLPDLLKHIYGADSSKAHIASFSVSVAEVASRYDPIAMRIFHAAGTELGSLLRGVLLRNPHPLPPTSSAILIGGVFKSYKLLESSFLKALQLPHVSLYTTQANPAHGPAFLALNTPHNLASPPVPHIHLQSLSKTL